MRAALGAATAGRVGMFYAYLCEMLSAATAGHWSSVLGAKFAASRWADGHVPNMFQKSTENVSKCVKNVPNMAPKKFQIRLINKILRQC